MTRSRRCAFAFVLAVLPVASLGAPAFGDSNDDESPWLRDRLVARSWKIEGSIDPSSVPVVASDFISLAASIAPTQMVRLNLAGAAKLATGSGVTVAVLDSGFNLAHPALKGRLAKGPYDALAIDSNPNDLGNRVDDDGDGIVDNGVGHGTFVASLIARIAPNAKILAIRIADDEGRGTAVSLAEGLRYAIAAGAKVINVSFTLDAKSYLVRTQLDAAENVGAVVVCAAGNDGTDVVLSFAKDPRTLAVGAVDDTDRLASFSNFGAYVDFYAPGVSLLGAYGSPTNKSDVSWSGTSFSAAFGSGAAALVKQRHPTYTAASIRVALTTSVVSAYDISGAPLVGGRLDLNLAAAK